MEQDAHLFDMHCHLGFVSDADAVRRCLEHGSAAALSCTVLPAEYERDRETFAGLEACTVALGLHPWQAADGTAREEALERFEELAPTTRFIGEVGLDHTGDRGEEAARERQRSALSQVLAACDAPSAFPRKLLSLHAVHAAADVLDLLAEHDSLAHHQCIFHWFAGTAEELKRAVDAGCFFSVGPRMLATKRGREYARIIPEQRLLLETDAPAHRGDAWDCACWTAQLEQTLDALAEIRSVAAHDLARVIARTSEQLLRRA